MKALQILKKTEALQKGALAFILAGAFLSCPVTAEDRVWSKGSSATDFNNGSNYTPTGSIGGTARLIFDTETSPLLKLSAALAIAGLEIRGEAREFVLNSDGADLVVHDGGVSVRSGATAMFHGGIASNGNATQFTFLVEQNATMTVGGQLRPVSRPFYKKGEGTLVLNAGSGVRADNTIRNGAVLHIEEGALQLGDNARFEPGTSFTLPSLNVHIGTSSTRAALTGGGSMSGGSTGPSVTVHTAGSAHALIAPSGDGTLEIQNLNAAEGGAFRFALGESLIFGSGTFTGGDDLAFEFTGGEAGQLYTLFEYGTLAGVTEAGFSILTTGYEVDFWSIEGGMVQVRFAAVPEPATLGLAFLGCIAVAMGYKVRKE